MVIAPPDAGPYAFAEGMTDAVLLEESLRQPERFAVVFGWHSDEIYRYTARRLGPETAQDVVAETS